MKKQMALRFILLILALSLCGGALAQPDLTIRDTVAYLGSRETAYRAILESHEDAIRSFQEMEYKTWEGSEQIDCTPMPVGFADLNGDGKEEMLFFEMNTEFGADLSIWTGGRGVGCVFFLRNAAPADIKYIEDMQIYFIEDHSVIIEYIDEIGWGFLRLEMQGSDLTIPDIVLREDDHLQNETDRFFRNGQEISKADYQTITANWQSSKTTLIGAIPQKEKRTVGFDYTIEQALAYLGGTGGTRNDGGTGDAGSKDSAEDAEDAETETGNAGAQEADINYQLEQIAGETDRVKVCPESVTASSYIVNKQDPNRWLPSNATDGDESTCWQFSAKQGLKGKSWLELYIGAGEDVDEIWFKNGFWAVNDKGKDQYGINARPKGIRISYLYEGEGDYRDAKDYTLKDESRKGWQKFDVGHHANVAAVRIAILSTYKGSYYKNDVCLSEVMLVQDSPATGAKAAQGEKAATVYESYPWVTGCNLLMKLATRSGPGTEFQEPGTFFGKNWQSTTVKVLKKSWDGSIWWVQVEFDYGNYGKYRVWTGKKRVDVDLDKVEKEASIGNGHVMPTKETYYGPGTNYAKANITIRDPADTIVYAYENGFVDIEYRYPGSSRKYRVWVREEATYDMSWFNGYPGGAPDIVQGPDVSIPERDRP